jgi:hypothetical protein
MKVRKLIMPILAKYFYQKFGHCNYYNISMRKKKGCGICSVCNWEWKCAHWSFIEK